MARRGTPVSNHYNEDIFVMVVADKRHLDEVDARVGVKAVSVGVGVKVKTEIVEKQGYTRIKSKTVLKFYVDKKQVYISIQSESGRDICKAFPCEGNTPVVVTSDGYIVTPKNPEVNNDGFVIGYGARQDDGDDGAAKVKTSLPLSLEHWVDGDVDEFIKYCDDIKRA